MRLSRAAGQGTRAACTTCSPELRQRFVADGGLGLGFGSEPWPDDLLLSQAAAEAIDQYGQLPATLARLVGEQLMLPLDQRSDARGRDHHAAHGPRQAQ